MSQGKHGRSFGKMRADEEAQLLEDPHKVEMPQEEEQ